MASRHFTFVDLLHRTNFQLRTLALNPLAVATFISHLAHCIQQLLVHHDQLINFSPIYLASAAQFSPRDLSSFISCDSPFQFNFNFAFVIRLEQLKFLASFVFWHFGIICHQFNSTPIGAASGTLDSNL